MLFTAIKSNVRMKWTLMLKQNLSFRMISLIARNWITSHIAVTFAYGFLTLQYGHITQIV